MTVLYCGIDHAHEGLVAIEPTCGCVAGMSVLTHNEAEAYKFAAQEAKDGLRVDRLSVETIRSLPFCCAEHPKGPPWWKSNGGKGKRPAPVGLGL